MSDDKPDPANASEPLLSRWSRRKLQPETEALSPSATNSGDAAVAAPVGAPAAGAAPAAAPPLPGLDTLDGLRSDYQAFMRPEVGELARRGALKKLFSDPHFNVMDGLDTYVGDYSVEDPIPDAMLRGLTQARGLMLFEEKPEAGADAAPSDGMPVATAVAAKAPPQAAATADSPSPDSASQDVPKDSERANEP